MWCMCVNVCVCYSSSSVHREVIETTIVGYYLIALTTRNTPKIYSKHNLSQKDFISWENWLILRLKQGKYKINLECTVMTYIKSVPPKWGNHIKRKQKQNWIGSYRANMSKTFNESELTTSVFYNPLSKIGVHSYWQLAN